MHRKILGLLLWLGLVFVGSGCATPTPTATVPLTIDRTAPGPVVPAHFLGINLSYFNDTAPIWQRNRMPETLRTAGIAALRYPGGQETSYFHWRHPGVNGYEDLWDDPAVHGTAVGRGRFQTTWVSPEKWAANRGEFMDFSRFMATCRQLGAEPVVGLNLSSGRKHHRRAEGLAEALEWLRTAQAAGHQVTYWYFDNETWNREANLTMTDKDYIEEILYFGRAIKAEFPGARIIVNPLSSAHIGDWARLERFLRATGEVVDLVDIHYYWEWGRSSVARWQAQSPLCSSDQWKPAAQVMPYRDEIARVRETAARAGFPQLGVIVLEWNIGPSAETRRLTEAQLAVMQSEMLLQFLEARVEMACLWPLIWPSNPEVWPQADRFPGIVTYHEPHRRTVSHDLLRLVSAVAGCARLPLAGSLAETPALAFARPEGGQVRVLLLNKSDQPRRFSLAVPTGGPWRWQSVETISMARGRVPSALPAGPEKPGAAVEFSAPAQSFSLLVLTRSSR